MLAVIATPDCVEVLIIPFATYMVSENLQVFWSELQRGELITDAASAAGTHRHRGRTWLRQSGGVRSRRGRDVVGRCLTFAEREEILVGRAAGQSLRVIAAPLGRSPSRLHASCRAMLILAAATGPARHTSWPTTGLAAVAGEAGGKLGTAREGRAGSTQEVLAGADHPQRRRHLRHRSPIGLMVRSSG